MAPTHPQHMVPHRRASEVYVEVGEAVLDPHETIALNLRSVEHDVFWGLVMGPEGRHPAEVMHYLGRVNQLRQSESRKHAKFNFATTTSVVNRHTPS